MAAVGSMLLPRPPDPAGPPKVTLSTLLGGFRFIWRCEAMLGAMSLDLVATLFGGVQALLPIYARDILDIGALGAGVLRSSPAVGALLAAAVLARVPIRKHAGIFMYAGVVVYGVMAIVFAFSQNVILSVTALILFGAGDMVSARRSPDHHAGDDAGRDARARLRGQFAVRQHVGSARLVPRRHDGGVARRGRLGRDRRCRGASRSSFVELAVSDAAPRPAPR